MAIVTRYFGTSSNGAADGTTWNDRAQLVNGSTWSSVITGFNFAGTDSLVCLIGPGTHTTTATLVVGSFTNAPTVTNTLLLHGCDSSGNLLSPTQPSWTSDQPATWDSSLPVIATTTNISTLNTPNVGIRLIKFTASARTLSVVALHAWAEWISIYNSMTSTTAAGLDTSSVRDTNIYVNMSGTSYAQSITLGSSSICDNIRCEGNSSASSGTRYGVLFSGTNQIRRANHVTVFNNPGGGVVDSTTTASAQLHLTNSNIINNAGAGILMNGTASQTSFCVIRSCMITGNGGWGIDAQSSNVILSGCRLRNNTSGSLTNFANYSTNINNDTSNVYASQILADAAEYANSSSSDFRIKFGSPIWGVNYGVSDQIAQLKAVIGRFGVVVKGAI